MRLPRKGSRSLSAADLSHEPFWDSVEAGSLPEPGWRQSVDPSSPNNS